ncbi:heme peroxidase [Morchella snyderi]|nr:heme peroxidase [Morchella snyderi]
MSVIGDLCTLRTDIHSLFDKGANKDENIYSKILEDLLQAGGDFAKNSALIVEIVKEKISGKPMDDRTMIMERMIQLVAGLPESSFARKKVTEVLVGQLWNSLQHPPVSYVGPLYQNRQPDGSYNNTLQPNLGKAGTPYARSLRPCVIKSVKSCGAKPDPGLIFDLLMSRGDTFDENPGGISSMLLYHASIITHDIFRTDRRNQEINETSSYLDLSPLYGCSQDEQNKVRSFQNGELKPDTFSDARLLGFPPGVSVMLIMYSRFHNYAARTLAAINEGGRFTPPRHIRGDDALKWSDERLFQVARLVTNGLYVNISLHDYLRGIANVNSTESTWTLDPRVEIDKAFDKEEVPRGVGNHVSCEFNLLYRFHSAISDRDAKWTLDFYHQILGTKEDPKLTSLPKMLEALVKFEVSIPKDPSTRVFGGLARGPDGTFSDDELVKILKESIEDPAGRFGANHVPDIMKPVEILGIIQARSWQVAPLNEFRDFFKLKRYETFEDINPDPYVATTLKRLYGHPDNVELYPGMFLEASKPRMDPGMGLCAPYTVSRAVFSDAITLVRGDRFLTLDYTPSNLTSWGITEVSQDSKILGGAKMYHLILNAFPNHFKYNSVYAMQPFYTPTEGRRFFTKFRKTHLYSFEPPAPQPAIIPVVSHAALREVLADKKNFRVPWGAKMASLESYMLASDSDASAQQREVVNNLLYGVDGAMQKFAVYTEEIILKLLRRESYELGRHSVYQVDIVKHIGNYAALHFAAKLFYLPLLSSQGTSYTEPELLKVLCDLTTYVFSDADPTKSWARRQASHAGTKKLCSEMEDIVRRLTPLTPPAACPVIPAVQREPPKTLIGGAIRFGAGRIAQRAEQARAVVGAADAVVTTILTGGSGGGDTGPLEDYGVNFARKLLGAGKQAREVAEILVGTASAFVANTATAVAQLIDFYLEQENCVHWAEIQRLSAQNTALADKTLTHYVLEGMRLSNSLGLFRDVAPVNGVSATITQNGKTIAAKKGDRVFVSFVAASRDPTVFPSPLEVRLDRPLDSYITFGEGPHQCLGKDLNIVHSLTMLKVMARLKGLRRTPGDEGRLKYIKKTGGIKLYMNPEWSEFTPYPTTMKLMFDGPP